MKYVAGRNPHDCAIACTAMLADITYERAEDLFPRYYHISPIPPHIEGTSIEEMAEVLFSMEWALIQVSSQKLLHLRRGLVIKQTGALAHAAAWNGYRVYDPAVRVDLEGYGDLEIWKPEIQYICVRLP